MTENDALFDPVTMAPDDLGDVGESTFRALCAKARMIANSSGRDRAGWDYVVQIQADADPDVRLDDRAVLWTNYVQVKAAWRSGRPRIRLTLSAAEKLAKQTDPAFVAALLFDRNDLDRFDVYMVELTGDRLAAVLKALRMQERDGVRAINHVPTYITLRSDERLSEPSGAAVRERLAEAHRTTAPETYAAVKSRELKTIGYPPAPLRGVVTLHDIDRASLFDFLLGKKAWSASLSGFMEKRFDIDLPMRGAPQGEGFVRFNPVPQARCELTATSRALRGRQTFHGDHHRLTLPGPKGLETRSRFCFPGFAIEYGDGRVNFKTANAGESAHSIADWLRLWMLTAALRKRSVDFSLRTPLSKLPIQWTFPAAPDDISVDIDQTVMAAEAARDIGEELSLDWAPVTFESLAVAARGLMMARHLGGRDRQRLSIGIRRPRPAYEEEADTSREGVYVDFVDFGGVRIAFSVWMRMLRRPDGDEDMWESNRARRLDIRRIGETPEDFAAFAEDARSQGKTEALFLGDVDDEFLRLALGDVIPFEGRSD